MASFGKLYTIFKIFFNSVETGSPNVIGDMLSEL